MKSFWQVEYWSEFVQEWCSEGATGDSLQSGNAEWLNEMFADGQYRYWIKGNVSCKLLSIYGHNCRWLDEVVAWPLDRTRINLTGWLWAVTLGRWSCKQTSRTWLRLGSNELKYVFPQDLSWLILQLVGQDGRSDHNKGDQNGSLKGLRAVEGTVDGLWYWWPCSLLSLGAMTM